MLKWIAIIGGGLYILNQMSKAALSTATNQTGVLDSSYTDPRSASDMMMVPNVGSIQPTPTNVDTSFVSSSHDFYDLSRWER